jgi:hypothetical protein
MERGHEAKTQKSSRRSARQTWRSGAQRGQTPRQPGEWAQGWAGEKPQEENCSPPQCTTSAARPPQEIINVIELIPVRFGARAIGLGNQGIRFAGIMAGGA